MYLAQFFIDCIAMITCLNGSFYNNLSVELCTNRGFMYGDGLFETMLFENNKIKHFSDHLERLVHGMTTLGYFYDDLTLKEISENTLLSCQKSNLSIARVKLTVWRNWGGLYAPTTNQISFLIEVNEYTQTSNEINNLGIAKTVKIAVNNVSNLKTLSALQYVLAGIEKANSALDDLVLLNTDNYICECTASNLFWKKEGIVYTPSLKSGCISGIGRKNEIISLKLNNIQVEEGLYEVKSLVDADKIWNTNVFGRKKVINFIYK